MQRADRDVTDPYVTSGQPYQGLTLFWATKDPIDLHRQAHGISLQTRRVPLIEHSQKTIGVLREQSAVRAVTRTGGIL